MITLHKHALSCTVCGIKKELNNNQLNQPIALIKQTIVCDCNTIKNYKK